MLDIEDQVETQVNGQTNKFGEFFTSCSSNDNQHTIVNIPCHNIHLPSSNTIGLSSDVLHTPSKDDLFGKFSNLDLLTFAYQEACELSDTESQSDARPNLKIWDCISSRDYGFTYEFNNIKVKIKAKFDFNPFFDKSVWLLTLFNLKRTFLLLLILTLVRV